MKQIQPHRPQLLIYEQLAKQIEREDGLVNTRLTWTLTTQGLLFAALAFMGKQYEVNYQSYKALAIVLPSMGLTLSIFGLLGINAARESLQELKGKWESIKDEGFIRPFGGPGPHKFGMYQSTAFPAIFIIGWIVIMCILWPFEQTKVKEQNVNTTTHVVTNLDTTNPVKRPLVRVQENKSKH